MPASDPTLVIGSGGSGTFSINGSPLGCIIGELQDNGSRSINSYQSLCDDAGAYEQGTPGALTRELSAEVEFLAGGTGIAAAEAALASGALATLARTFAGQTSGSDAKTYQGYVTQVRKAVAPGNGAGRVSVTARVVADGAGT